MKLSRQILGVMSITILMSLPNIAEAFPEMTRLGYANCVSCHISPNGGGVLNDYGRSIVREKLALWKSPDETNREHLFAYGALADSSVSKWLKGGGDTRMVWVYRNDQFSKQSETILMQADLELAAVTGRWTFVGSLGAERGRDEAEFGTREDYALYTLDDHWRARAGRFTPSYGIITPDHVTLTRDPLRIGFGFETDNIEVSRIDEQWSFFLDGMFGRISDDKQTYDSGFVAQAAFAPTERMKVGLNTWNGTNAAGQRWLWGGFAMLGFTDRLYASSDFSFINPEHGNDGFASTQRISYELTDGLWLYGTQEWAKYNFNNPLSQNDVYGAGFQFFPRSHFEFNLAYEYRHNKAVQTGGYDYAWVMSHFYL